MRQTGRRCGHCCQTRWADARNCTAQHGMACHGSAPSFCHFFRAQRFLGCVLQDELHLQPAAVAVGAAQHQPSCSCIETAEHVCFAATAHWHLDWCKPHPAACAYHLADIAQGEGFSEEPGGHLDALLSGTASFHFGNPTAQLWEVLSSGAAAPRVRRQQELVLQVKQQLASTALRTYHNQQVRCTGWCNWELCWCWD